MSFTERRQRVTDTSGMLVFLEVSASSFAETLRIAADTKSWTSNGVHYIGFPFGLKLPDDTAGQVPRTQIVIDNVGRSITEDLERRAPGDTVWAKLMITDKANPDVYERVYNLPLMQVSVNQSTVTASAGFDFLTRQQAVRLRFTPFLTPGLF